MPDRADSIFDNDILLTHTKRVTNRQILTLCENKQPMYRPNALLDLVKTQLDLKNDVALAHALGVLPSAISNIRHERLRIGDCLLVRIHEEIGLSIRELRRLYIPGSLPKLNANISPARWQELELQPKIIESAMVLGVNRLLDTAIDTLGLKSDRALSRALEVPAPVISKLRHGRIPLGPSILLRLHEATGISTRELKSFLPIVSMPPMAADGSLRAVK